MSRSVSLIGLILPFILFFVFLAIVAGIVVAIVLLTKKSSNKSNAQYNQAHQADAMRRQRLIHYLHTQRNVSPETLSMLSAMSFVQIQNFALQNQLLDQQMMQQMFDPYMNPGIDLVVDQYYHGIDRGLEPQPDHHQMNNHDFGNGGFGNDSNGNNGM